MKEFWNETATRSSWKKLEQLAREYDFILIGGWAAYLWTKTHKSKDIDIIVDYNTLDKLSRTYTLTKNDRLKKYEIKQDDFDIDLYLPYYSELGLPVEELEKHTSIVMGIKTVNPEALLILKQTAEIQRRASLKGRKDLIDILTILVHAPIDYKKYQSLLNQNKKAELKKELIKEIELFREKDLDYIGLNKHSYAKWKKGFLRKTKQKSS